ncbi:MAG: thioesterase family protein, partial [Pseudomonadota bacterium]
MKYTDLIKSISLSENGALKLTIPETWMQGRTTYGGLTAAFCFEATRGVVDDLPVRSAQVAFVGPVGGDVMVTPKLLRRGKNTAFVSVDLTAEDAVMAQCIFAFGKSRQSQLDFAHVAMPEVPDPETAASFFREGPRPGFTQNFNMKGVLGDPPMSGSDQPAIGLWLRNKDEATPTDATAVLAIADCPPPAALSMQHTPAPISSMTWMAEFLT